MRKRILFFIAVFLFVNFVLSACSNTKATLGIYDEEYIAEIIEQAELLQQEIEVLSEQYANLLSREQLIREQIVVAASLTALPPYEPNAEEYLNNWQYLVLNRDYLDSVPEKIYLVSRDSVRRELSLVRREYLERRMIVLSAPQDADNIAKAFPDLYAVLRRRVDVGQRLSHALEVQAELIGFLIWHASNEAKAG